MGNDLLVVQVEVGYAVIPKLVIGFFRGWRVVWVLE